MNLKIEEEIGRLAAAMGVTFEEAKEVFEQSVQDNQMLLGGGVIVCECPMTGTIELMPRR